LPVPKTGGLDTHSGVVMFGNNSTNKKENQMKLSLLIGAAILFLSGTAIAHDMTYLALAKPHETKQMSVDLPAGKSVVEVWSEDHSKISCTFVQRATGEVVYEATNVDRCIGNAKLTLPVIITMRITNHEDKDAYLRVWVRDSR
jgi:hypothetical protein